MAEATLSFARQVKEEIVRLDRPDETKRALLSGYLRINGAIHISGGHDSLSLSTESAQIAKTLYSYITNLYGVNARFAYTRGINFHKRVQYHVLIDEPDYILGDLEVDYFSGKIPENLVKGDEMASNYLIGSFLASGSVNAPISSNYHLEIAVNDEQYARWLMHLFNKVQGGHFEAKMSKRRKQWIVYIKRSDQISDFLILMGARECCLEFENVRVDRDFANIGNRLMNLDSSNFKKTMKAAERQKMQIEYLESKGVLARLGNPKILILARLRKEHEDASLDELAKLLSEETATTISKSNINHLFRSIDEVYKREHGE
ncbi:MAG: DNA-binding protein WhiA [Bacilli bacterium]|nr:DNA-binding protein WhiA [Bacilli bacterium]